MQPTRTKNWAALCLDSSRLILAVSLIHGEPEGEAVSFHYKYMSASKCGGPHRLGLGRGGSLPVQLPDFSKQLA